MSTPLRPIDYNGHAPDPSVNAGLALGALIAEIVNEINGNLTRSASSSPS
jgi:hypothetical protein